MKKRTGLRTLSRRQLTRLYLRFGKLLYPDQHPVRPRQRSECQEGPRPCPWVACKWHLYLDVNPVTGSIKCNFPDLEPWELEETCALDVADRGGLTLDAVAELLNVTRERVRQIEAQALDKVRRAEDLAELTTEDPEPLLPLGLIALSLSATSSLTELLGRELPEPGARLEYTTRRPRGVRAKLRAVQEARPGRLA